MVGREGVWECVRKVMMRVGMEGVWECVRKVYVFTGNNLGELYPGCEFNMRHNRVYAAPLPHSNLSPCPVQLGNLARLRLS
jgi:hypothetical protein